MKLTNAYAGALTFREDGLPETIKDDKDYHGFGVRSIKSIAEKYGGMVKLRAENGEFTLQITFTPTE